MKEGIKILAYGSWPSPVTAEILTSGSIDRDYPCEVNGVIYWQESRPDEQGRTTIVAHYPDGCSRDLLPPPISCQSKVHEYGGRAWLVAGGFLYYVDKSDQRIYRTPLPNRNEGPVGFSASALTPQNQGLSFADFVLDEYRQRLIAICERHLNSSDEPENFIAAISLDNSQTMQILVSGADFYAYPRVSPDATKMCWIAWNHPQMPWDGTELNMATFDVAGGPVNIEIIAGGEVESIFQPSWSPDGKLYFVSDRTGWWNLYRYDKTGVKALCPMEAEFATPLWSLGMHTYDFIDKNRIAAVYTAAGEWELGLVDVQQGERQVLKTNYTLMSSPSCTKDGRILFVGASSQTKGEICSLNRQTNSCEVLVSGASNLDPDDISVPRSVTFPTGDGEYAYGLFYQPANSGFTGPKEERPPLIIMCHGGPTGANYGILNYKIQYWTSRGFALLDVNYRGSTGFGREYREKLKGRWGEADVADVVAGSDWLVSKGLVDGNRIIIRGSSAGGFTVLAALTFSNTFAAGASLYGIGDLEALARDTHKFEARYLDSLVGPYPEAKEVYRKRSPIHHQDQLNCPVIFFQGMEDKVVPPNQAEAMVNALKSKGIAVSYITFDDEGHGFRKAANIKRSLEAELAFYRKILFIPSQELLEDIPIDNFPSDRVPG